MDLRRATEFSHIVGTYFRALVPEINLEVRGVVHEAICRAGFNYLLRCSEYNIRRCIADGAKPHRGQAFDEIQVHRINIVEPDGTLRMVISDRDRFPRIIVKGKEFAKVDRPGAGLLFYNNEGTGNGGLVFGAHRSEKGEIVDSGGSLSFDKYGQGSQIVQPAGVDG